jgi:Ca-activated chloride channel family protein
LKRLLITVWVVVLLGGQGAAQDQHARFSSGVHVVQVYVSVSDATGTPVTGLAQKDFAVFEDGIAQPVTVFADGEFPLAIALGVDRSWSMAGEPLRLARQAAQTFLRALRPTDRSMIVAISSEAEVIAPLSSDRHAQSQAIAGLDPWGTTALHDAIIATLDRLSPEEGRGALVVFSDGIDRYSTATATQVLERARRSSTLIYPIAIGKTRPALLAELAVLTGGRSFLLKDARSLEGTLEQIAHELRHQYLLGYVPLRTWSDAGTWRSIRVVVRDHPAARVRARDGYSVP